MSASIQVIVDPRARLPYAWYYVQGLIDFTGRANVRFSSRPFAALQPHDKFSYERYVALVVQDHRRIRRFVVDFGDGPTVDANALAWADVYAKVNIDAEEAVQRGILPLGPSFGVGPAGIDRSRLRLLPQSIRAHEMGKLRDVTPDPRRLMGEYRYWRRLPSIEEHYPGRSDPQYAFYAGTLWTNKSGPQMNTERAAFMRVAREQLGPGFEGGFVPRPGRPTIETYKDLEFAHRIPNREWIAKTCRSVAVFNNPAVLGCYGWKLPQYMSLGKAIISMPLPYSPPREPAHGTHFHLVDSLDELPDAFGRIRSETRYRAKLENGSRDYWEAELAPTQVVQRLLSKS